MACGKDAVIKKKKKEKGDESVYVRERVNSAVSLHCKAPVVNFHKSMVAQSDGAVLYL